LLHIALLPRRSFESTNQNERMISLIASRTTALQPVPIFVLLIVLSPETVTAADGRPSWKQPLPVKERLLDANIQRRHNILGLYPSMVEVPRNNAEIDISTATPFSDIAHAVCWTSNHLAGASYRYLVLKERGEDAAAIAAAKRRADELFEAVYRCQRVTGVRGLQARGYLLGHGPVYEERRASDKRDEWHQGEVDGQAFRWRGDPSHHNYSDAIHGLAQYYDLCAEGEQKDRAREAIDALVSYWVDNDLVIHKLDRSRRGVPILGLTDGSTLNTRVVMAIAGARVAFHATGKEKFRAVHDRLIEQYGVRGLKSFRASKDFDDAEHVFCHLENLFRIEKDPELLDAWGVVADALWANHRDDAHSLFNYIYYSIRPDAQGREEALQDAYRSLETWPTETTVEPRMNSLFPDRKPPFPVYQAAWDNEYIWKGNLLRADGWLSRIVTSLDVSPEDPSMLAAAEQSGDLYISRDGAASFDGWEALQDQPGHVLTVSFGRRSRQLAVACREGFFVSTTGGQSWNELSLPPDSGDPVRLFFDETDPLRLVAITQSGVYRSRNFGEEYLGQSWDCLTADLPRKATFDFHVASGGAGMVYARNGDDFLTRTLQSNDWKRGGTVGLGSYTSQLSFFAVDSTDASVALCGAASLGNGPFPVHTIVQRTIDGGQSWSNGMEAIFSRFADGSLPAFLASQPKGKVKAMAMDPSDRNTVYAIADRGVLRSRDGGSTWEQHETGLDIPVAHSLLVPAEGGRIFVGTPAGLYVSDDQGETWQSAHLVLQFRQNYRRELGGAAFIDAYWRGRYYGFIED